MGHMTCRHARCGQPVRSRVLDVHHTMDQRAHSNRKLRFQGFCRSIRLIEQVFWSFYSTVRSDIQYWLAFSWPYNLLSDKVLLLTVYSCANAPAGPSCSTNPDGCGRLYRGRGAGFSGW